MSAGLAAAVGLLTACLILLSAGAAFCVVKHLRARRRDTEWAGLPKPSRVERIGRALRDRYRQTIDASVYADSKSPGRSSPQAEAGLLASLAAAARSPDVLVPPAMSGRSLKPMQLVSPVLTSPPPAYEAPLHSRFSAWTASSRATASTAARHPRPLAPPPTPLSASTHRPMSRIVAGYLSPARARRHEAAPWRPGRAALREDPALGALKAQARAERHTSSIALGSERGGRTVDLDALSRGTYCSTVVSDV